MSGPDVGKLSPVGRRRERVGLSEEPQMSGPVVGKVSAIGRRRDKNNQKHISQGRKYILTNLFAYKIQFTITSPWNSTVYLGLQLIHILLSLNIFCIHLQTNRHCLLPYCAVG